MKKFVLGLIVGLSLSGAVAFAGPMLSELAKAQQMQNDVSNRVQALLGNLQVALIQTQSQLKQTQDELSTCHEELSNAAYKKGK